MNAIGMVFLAIATVDILLIVALLVRQLAKDGMFASITEFVLEMFYLQVELRHKVFENGIYASMFSLAYTIMTANWLGAVASLAVWLMCLTTLNYIRRAK